ASGDKVQLHWKSENCTILQVDGTRAFNYDCVFHSNDSTQQVYEGVAVPIIKSAVQGYNGTIFAYGQTASGKTYTMMGSDKSTGIIPKAVQDVFKIICEIPGREFLLRVSYMEIYNETITDLLCDSRKNKPLGIREDVNRNIYVEDLIEEVVVTPEQVMEWLRKGEKKRHYGETKMNEHSSRSHTIFRMIIESRENDPANTNCDGAVMVSHLNLVDLAGSERASQTGSEGVRLKEGCNINRSLFILGQVIKKLCDDPSGFINYRDSKLTRILQNSLGGNAKTVIICTITPVSFDETLSTLQFANTAKRMRNTPKVNEVLDDDALLKRYRKEIVDLKRQLEEVSSKTHLHAMEKDQLAQLLEEKNSLQKIQENRIFNLTEMLVTSSSFTSQKDLKVRVSNYSGSHRTPGKILTSNWRRCFVSMFSEYSEYDYLCPPTPDVVSESEWNSGANMNWVTFKIDNLIKDNINEVNVLQANFDNLVLENEQLKLEISELKEKLKEKIETDEFEELEKQTQKDHEMQLIHEITNLQNIVKNAEVYNEDLETELKSKLEQLKEKENEVKNLQKYGDSDKLLDEIQQMSKSLVDTETVALDAKRESAFLRSENLELKEKMNELLNGYKQMEKNVQLYQSQLEAGKVNYKKMQVDLQRELQSAFQENTKLTLLLEGKVPKDLLSLVELERKIADLKNELDKALEENTVLRKEVDTSSEFKSLPDKVEMLQKQIFEKSQELCLLTSEREKLLSEVADKEARLQGMTEEIRISKEDLASTQLKYVKADQEYLELKGHHEELEQKWLAASEESEQMKHQVELLSDEAQKLKTVLSNKIQELQEKTAEQEQLLGRLSEMEQLKEKSKTNESRMEAERMEKLAIVQKLHESQEEIKILIQERDDLKQKHKTLQNETDQLKEDIQETIETNAEMQEELKNAYSSLKQHQETIEELKGNISEKETQLSKVQETLGKTINDLKQKVNQLTEALNSVSHERHQLVTERTNHYLQLQEQISSINQEKDELQQILEGVKSERDLLKTELQKNIDMFLFSRVCQKKAEYYTTINNHEMDLLDEKRKQEELLSQIRCLKKTCLKQDETASQELNFHELQQRLDLHIEHILRDMSEIETELLSIEAELQQEESARKEALQFLETCSGNHCDVEKFKDGIKQDNERLLQVIKFWTPKVKVKVPAITIMKTTIQKLENAVNEARKNVKEKEERIVMLQTEIKMKAAASELNQLQAKLNETEKCLRNALTEKQTLKVCFIVKLQLFKQNVTPIFHLRAGRKSEKVLEGQHVEANLLHYMLLIYIQIIFPPVISEKDVPQESHMPLTCGGGSGIVQSTHMLILKSEQAKLQKENLQLKKNNDLLVSLHFYHFLLLSNELQLKEELTKWKERALKMRAESCRDTTREKIQRSPRKTTPCSVKEQMPSPSKEVSSREILPLDSPNTLPLTCPNFFDNSSLGTLTGA
uniref:Centromere-associated protein E n=1 Tax=Gopherus agassizii TaxID=38772 RepID=A0A452GUH1_9SAUR